MVSDVPLPGVGLGCAIQNACLPLIVKSPTIFPLHVIFPLYVTTSFLGKLFAFSALAAKALEILPKLSVVKIIKNDIPIFPNLLINFCIFPFFINTSYFLLQKKKMCFHIFYFMSMSFSQGELAKTSLIR